MRHLFACLILLAACSAGSGPVPRGANGDAGADASACSGPPIPCFICNSPTSAECLGGQWTCPDVEIACSRDGGNPIPSPDAASDAGPGGDASPDAAPELPIPCGGATCLPSQYCEEDCMCVGHDGGFGQGCVSVSYRCVNASPGCGFNPSGNPRTERCTCPG
jgi:hypothetical protein